MFSRIKELDFLRVLAMVWVITYHFGCEYSVKNIPFFNFFYVTPNYDFGNIAVTIFIMLSGGLLYSKYGECFYKKDSNISYKDFYLKRAKSIYPPFWILNLYIPLTMFRHYLSEGNAFFAGNPLKLLLTVLGVDGYASILGFKVYYFSGEWFVGAILFLYLLFPILAKAYYKCPIKLFIFLLMGYCASYILPQKYMTIFSILPFAITLKFCLGFLLIKNVSFLKKNLVLIFATLLFLLITFINIPGFLNTDFLGSLAALFLLPLLFFIATFFKHPKLEGAIQKLAKLSYCVFLLQHIAICWSQLAYIKIFSRFSLEFSKFNSAILLAITFVLILIAAWMLNKITSIILAKVFKNT